MASVGNVETSGEPVRRRKKRWLLPLFVLALAGGAGFGLTYLDVLKRDGLRSPASSFQNRNVSFVEVPPISVPMAGDGQRQVFLAFSLEVAREDGPAVHHYLPRIIDTATLFLGGIAPDAYARRGIMEIIRDELKNRFNMALEEELIRNVLLTEFAFR